MARRPLAALAALALLAAAGAPHTAAATAITGTATVTLSAKWDAAPLVLEAAEFLADESPAHLWAFADAWSPSPTTSPNDTCWAALARVAGAGLPPPLARALLYSLAARHHAAKVALLASLLEDDVDKGARAAAGDACCLVALPGGAVETDPARVKAALAAVDAATPSPPLYEFDHVYPIDGEPSASAAAVLYAPPGAPCFAALHSTLASAASPSLTYVWRPVLPSPACADAGGCLALGAGGRLALPGFGAEFALKSTEYLAVDDAPKDEGDADAKKDAKTAASASLPDTVDGFIFSTLKARAPSAAAALDALHERLLDAAARADDAPIKVWDLKDLGLQAAARVLAAPDPLRALADGAATFPNAAPRLVRVPVPSAIRAAATAAGGRRFQPGASMLAINGLLLDAAGVELTDAVDAVRHELRLAAALAAAGVPAGDEAALLRLRGRAGLDDADDGGGGGGGGGAGAGGGASPPPRVDLVTPARAAIAWANDIETDAAYAAWPQTLRTLLQPTFPGQLPSVGLNLLTAVLLIDPCAPTAPALAGAAADALTARWPLRVGVLPLPQAAVDAALSDGDADAPPRSWADCGDCERVARALAAATAAGSRAGLAALAALDGGKRVTYATYADALRAAAAKERGGPGADAVLAAAASGAEATRSAAAARAAAAAGLAPAPHAGAAIWLNGALLPPATAAGGDARRLLGWGVQTEIGAVQTLIYYGDITQADADGIPDAHEDDEDDDDEDDEDDGTHLLAKVLAVGGALARYNPRATARAVGTAATATAAATAATTPASTLPLPRQLRLTGALNLSAPPLASLRYAVADHGPSLKPATHWAAVDVSHPAGRALARALVAHLASPEEAAKAPRPGAPPPPPPRAAGGRAAVVHCASVADAPPHSLARAVAAASSAAVAATGRERRALLASLLNETVAARVAADADAADALAAAAAAAGVRVKDPLSVIKVADATVRAHAGVCAALGLAPGRRALVTNGRVLVDGDGAAAALTPADVHLVESHSSASGLAAMVGVVARAAARRGALAAQGDGPTAPACPACDVTAAAAAEMLASPPNPVAAASARGAAVADALDAEAASVLAFDAAAASTPASPLHIAAVVDPLSPAAQRLAPLLLSLRDGLAPTSLRVLLHPTPDLTALPLTTYYAASLPAFGPAPAASADAGAAYPPLGEPLPPAAVAAGLPASKILTLNLHVPEGWLAEAVDAGAADLDNLVLANLPGRALAAAFEVESLLLTGSCVDVAAVTRDAVTPRGVQLELLTRGGARAADTLVMANLGYFQLQAPAPRVYSLALARGSRSAALYSVSNATGPADGRPLGGERGAAAAAAARSTDNDTAVTVAVDSLTGRHIALRLRKRPGREGEDVLGGDGAGGPARAAARGWMALFGGGGSAPSPPPSSASTPPALLSAEDDPDCIHIFTVASGHMYERLQKIMALSVLAHTRSRVKFWFIKNYMSPSMRAVLPRIAAEKGFEYAFVTYKWPHWLHKQTEKQRVIWAYKILFLDVLFPLNLKKVIFVDSDQIVRADFAELWRMDLKGAPYAYTPFCDSNADMDGFRFWKTGFWATHLAGKPYHISALYVVDLARFRALAAGDRLRVTYDSLSRDPASLANLDQDLPNYAQHAVPIHSLPQEWLWCETWCGGGTKAGAKTIDLCNNPLTKEPKLDAARRIAPEWVEYDREAAALTARAEAALAAERSGVVEGGGVGAGGAVHDEL